jgi:alkylated DNA repair dioxygenase AlkB
VNPSDRGPQPDLFEAQSVSFDPSFQSLQREWLDPGSWVDHAPSWVQGSQVLFQQILQTRSWGQRTRWMYERKVQEPRLTDLWVLSSGARLEPPLIEDLRRALSARYRVQFDSVGFNWYRDGKDSVAWHRDRIRREVVEPIVALVSLGDPRKFLIRPRGGGPSRGYSLGRGDLFVTGGLTQRLWDHSVPKVAHAGPRISLAFRQGMDVVAYGNLD